MTRPARFTQADVARVIKAAERVGKRVSGVDLINGVLIFDETLTLANPAAQTDPFLQGIANAAAKPKKGRRHAVA